MFPKDIKTYIGIYIMILITLSLMASISSSNIFSIVNKLDIGGAAILGQSVKCERINSGSRCPENSGFRVESISGIDVGAVEGDVGLKKFTNKQ